MTSARPDDPFAVFGLDRSASLAELRTVRRRLARELHPDHGGDAVQMQTVNEAFDLCVGHLTGRRPLPPVEPERPRPTMVRTPSPRGPVRPRMRMFREPPWTGVEHDSPSFTIDALPAEAFEALLVVASWIGEVVDDDPPYTLDCRLTDPAPCWCRLELVPDAGGSTVSLTVAGARDPTGATGRPSAEQVRDVWVEQLNRLGQPPP